MNIESIALFEWDDDFPTRYNYKKRYWYNVCDNQKGDQRNDTENRRLEILWIS